MSDATLYRCHSRYRKKSGNQVQDAGVALIGIIETRCIDQDEAGSAGHVDELNRWWVYG